MTDDNDVLFFVLFFAMVDRNWPHAKELIDKMNTGEEADDFAYGIGHRFHFAVLRFARQAPRGASSSKLRFSETRELLNQRSRAPRNARLLSQSACSTPCLTTKKQPSRKPKFAVEMLPISKDAVDGPQMALNLPVVYHGPTSRT